MFANMSDRCECTRKVDEKLLGDRCFSCDKCRRKLCEECSSRLLNPTEVRTLQLKKNRRLKFFCNTCLKQLTAEESREEKLWEAVRESVENMKRDIIDEVMQKLENVEIKMSQVQESLASFVKMPEMVDGLKRELERSRMQVRDETVNKGVTYAEKVKAKCETLIIQPKPGTSQQAVVTKNEVKASIDPAVLEIGVTKMKELRDGGVIVSCETSEERDRLKNAMESKLSEKYTTQVIEKRKPRIFIRGIEEEMTEEELKTCLVKQNECLGDGEVEIRSVKKMKRNYTAVIETNSSNFNAAMREGKLRVGWRICPVSEYIYVMRCYRCCGYNHKADKCTNEECCRKCAGRGHKAAECESQETKCVNCYMVNEKLKLNLDCLHGVYDTECPVYLRQMSRQRERVEYI